MPPQLTQEDLDYLQKQGIDPSSVELLPPDQMSAGGASVATLKGHAGSYAGGGIGAITGAKVGAGIGAFGGPFDEFTVPAGAIIGAATGGLIGSYGGQKAQQAILPQDTEASLEQQAALAQEQHPYVSGATDIAAGALASGGSFKPSNVLKAGRGIYGKIAGVGLSDAEKMMVSQGMESGISDTSKAALTRQASDVKQIPNIALQSAVNPAINAGLSYATSGQFPTGKELLAQSVGGALFSGQSALGRKLGGFHNEEPQEATQTTIPLKVGHSDIMTGKDAEAVPEVISPYTEKGEDGGMKISDSVVKQAYLKDNLTTKDELSKMSDTDKYVAMTQNDRLRKFMSVDEMRDELHQKWVEEQSKTTPEALKMVTPVDDKVSPPVEQVRMNPVDAHEFAQVLRGKTVKELRQ